MRYLLILFTILALQANDAVYILHCSSCHGLRGEVRYLDIVPPIRSIPSKERLKMLKQYKYGDRNVYKYGIIMKANIVKFGDTRIKEINKYIGTFKDDFKMDGNDGK